MGKVKEKSRIIGDYGDGKAPGGKNVPPGAQFYALAMKKSLALVIT